MAGISNSPDSQTCRAKSYGGDDDEYIITAGPTQRHEEGGQFRSTVAYGDGTSVLVFNV